MAASSHNTRTWCGSALKFYSSVRLDVRKIDTIKQGDKILGSRTRVKVVKNKVAPPFKQAEFDIMYGEGISKIGDLLDIAANVDIVKNTFFFAYAFSIHDIQYL